MGCLDEETITAFAETRLPPEHIARLEGHVRDCDSCRSLVSLALAAAPRVDTPLAGEEPPPGARPGGATASHADQNSWCPMPD